jgi:hypothetical protein
MNNPARIKRLLSTHAHLLSAKQYVSLRVPSDIPDSHVALAEVEQRLSEEALVSCMDLLAACGVQERPRGGFWRDMERAAEALGHMERATAYRARFLFTLSIPTHEASGVGGGQDSRRGA